MRNAAVIGSGVMGSGIAAHLANSGIACLLLDRVPESLTAHEAAQGMTLVHPKVRNRFAEEALVKLKKSKPAVFYSEEFAQLIRIGNLEDHFDMLGDVDWIIEVVVEDLHVKRQLLQRIEKIWKPGMIVSSNTSGISINEMVSECGVAFKKHFLGTHFFNPPRYMKLLEMIPGIETDPQIVHDLVDLCERKLGKGVVVAKDTPNFIANRIGTFGLLVTLHEMQEKGYTVEEVDAVTGPAMGRPGSATLRTLDLVGLDTFVHVVRNVYDNVIDEAEKLMFQSKGILSDMVGRGWIGEKMGQGFYQKIKRASGSEIHALNLQTMEYAACLPVSSASLDASKQAKGPTAKLQALLSTPDRYSELAWDLLKQVLIYSADKLGEIADSIVEIDKAMRWGFNWDLGPFEIWDAIGVRKSVQRMEADGLVVPGWVKEWLEAGNESFYLQYESDSLYCLKNEYQAMETKPELIALSSLKQQNKVILSNRDASLIDLGDGVACLEFHSPNNAIGNDILNMIQQSVEEVSKNYRGLVIANEGRNFCVGANIKQMLADAQAGDWNKIDADIHLFQQTTLLLKRLGKPFVAAPHRMALGGGVEISLPADRIIFSTETYFGLVETAVGLIPGGGGCKEMALRISRNITDPEVDLQPFLNAIFQTIGMAKVSTSGHDTKRLGFMRQQDFVVANPDYRIYEAKQAVIHLDQTGYTPQAEELIRVVGENGKAVMQLMTYSMRQGGYVSEHDQWIADKLAHVLSGGNVPAGTLVTPQYMLDLEREAFLSLCGEIKTQQRMQYMLSKGKALRN